MSDLHWLLDKIAAAKKPSSPAMPSLRPVKTPEQKRQEILDKRSVEIDLHQQWVKSGYKPQHLDPLLKSLTPLIESQANKFKGRVEIPNAAIDFEHKQRVVDALKSFDPSKGVGLSTWVTTNLKKANRFIMTHQNFARIPENIAQNIGLFNSAKADLTERLGHEPDAHTLADETGLSLKDVKRLFKEQRKGLIASGSVEDLSPAAHFSSREQEVIGLIYHQLTPAERAVHEYTFGINGKPLLKPGQIASRLKMDNSKVAKLRTSIFSKMKPYLE